MPRSRSAWRSKWTRSSPCAPDRLDPGPAGFAHRGLHGGGIAENSLSAFGAALEAGAGIECDVRLSADGEPVVFHDADLRRLCSDPARCDSLSANELASRRLAGGGDHIPRLTDVLALVSGKAPLLLELKSTGRDARHLARAVADLLPNGPNSVGVMSFDPRIGAWLARFRPEIRRGLVLSGRDGVFGRYLKVMRARPQFLAIALDAIDRTWVRRAQQKLPVYCWTVRSLRDRDRAALYADALIWEADGRP